jgi:hypothetical protein
MALTLYSAQLFFPGGNLAAGASVSISLQGSNQAPLIFTDSAGTTPAANPLTANGSGVVSFYAAPGNYLATLAGRSTPIPVDVSVADPVWPDLYIHQQLVAAIVWTVDHRFGVEPAVTILVSGQEVFTDVSHPSSETTLITFGSATAGTAHLRR